MLGLGSLFCCSQGASLRLTPRRRSAQCGGGPHGLLQLVVPGPRQPAAAAAAAARPRGSLPVTHMWRPIEASATVKARVLTGSFRVYTYSNSEVQPLGATAVYLLTSCSPGSSLSSEPLSCDPWLRPQSSASSDERLAGARLPSGSPSACRGAGYGLQVHGIAETCGWALCRRCPCWRASLG